MKRFIAGLLAGAVLMTTTAVFAENIDAAFGKVKLMVDGKAVDKETLLYNGTTYAPLRAAAEALGKEVTFDDATKTAHINSATSTKPQPGPVVTHPITEPEKAEKQTVKTAAELFQAFKDAGLPVELEKDINVGNDTGVGDKTYIERINFKDSRYPTIQTQKLGTNYRTYIIEVFESEAALINSHGDYLSKYASRSTLAYNFYHSGNILFLIPEGVGIDGILDYEKVFKAVTE